LTAAGTNSWLQTSKSRNI